MFEQKILTIADAKLDGDGPGRLSGYASTFGNVDSYGDTIVRGAYKSTIPHFLTDGFIPWGHDWAGYPVATPDKAREDDQGLWIEALFHSDAESQRARQIVAERLDRGKSMGLSIGYEAKGWDFQEMDGQQVRRLLDINLMEVSLVMVPADASAQVAAVKAKRRLSRHQLEAVIATLQALMGDDDEEAVAEELAADPIEDGKSADPPGEIRLVPISLDDLAVALLGHADAFATRLKTAPDADLTVEVERHLDDLRGALGRARGAAEQGVARASAARRVDAPALYREFRRLEGLYGPIHGGRRAG